MHSSIPSAVEVRVALEALDTGQMRRLAERSHVPFTTLWKVRSGETKNPGVETVRLFMPHLADLAKSPPVVPEPSAAQEAA